MISHSPPDPAAVTAPQTWTVPGAIFAALAFFMPVLATYGPKLVPVPALMALAGLFWLRHGVAVRPRGTALILLSSLLALVLWAALSVAWSVAPARSLQAALVLAAVVVGALGLWRLAAAAEPCRDAIARALVAGVLVAFVIYLAEYLSAGAGLVWLKGMKPSPEALFSLLNRGLAVLSLLFWPAALWFWRRGAHWAGAGLVLAALAVVFLGYGDSIKLALAFGLLAAVMAALADRYAARGIAALILVGLLASPFIATGLERTFDPRRTYDQWTNVSVPHRLIIWQFAAERIADRPLLGWGIDSAREVPGASAQVMIGSKPEVTYGTLISHHPHNAALQIWLELGLVGIVIVTVAFGAAGERLHRCRLDRLQSAAVVGQLTTAVGIASLSFGLWQAWWLVSLVLVAVITRAVLGASASPR